MSSDETVTPFALEDIPEDEGGRIENVERLTIERLRERYLGKAIRRGVHPKDHGCVTATFTVVDPLPEALRVGVFREPGRRFDAFIRFSNADVDPEKADSPLKDGVPTHGSRGMAIKLVGVTGTPLTTTNLMTTHGPLNQDFLMINQPVFAIANIIDYEALSEILLEDDDVILRFFQRLASPDEGVRSRAEKTRQIIARISSAESPPAFQIPPGSPLDNRYFSAAPFLFGEGRAMKFSARPVAPILDQATDFADGGYLRAALRKRLADAGDKPVEFDFQVQIRSAENLAGKLATDIEDVCTEWPEGDVEGTFPFLNVARISIQPQDQDIDSPERKALCEDLIFSPWNGLADHRPLGGINRLRRGVYEASATARHASGVCPWRVEKMIR